MTDEKPWEVTDEEKAAHLGRADEWWARASSADRRQLWDYLTVEYADPVLDYTTGLAQLTFFEMARRFPNHKIGDSQ